MKKPITSREDNQYIEQYLNGNEKALEFLVEKYLKAMYSFAYQKVGNAADAQDLAQDIFLKVWKNIKKFDNNKSFKPWLFQIAKNTCIDYLRKKKSIPFSKFENDKGQNALVDNLRAPAFNILDILHNQRELAVITQNLTPAEHKIISLRHQEQMTFREIAEHLEESINTIKSRYRRIIRNLRGKTHSN